MVQKTIEIDEELAQEVMDMMNQDDFSVCVGRLCKIYTEPERLEESIVKSMISETHDLLNEVHNSL